MKQKLVLFVAVMVGVLAFVMNAAYLKRERESIYRDAKKIDVYVARKSMNSGSRVSAEDIIAQEVFEVSVPRTVFQGEKGRRALLQMNGRLRVPVREGDAFFPEQFETSDLLGARSFSNQIGSDLRAISIPVSQDTSVAGLVRPDDEVDILGTFSFPSETMPGEMETLTLTVLQRVKILATGQTTGNEGLATINDPRFRRRNTYSTVTIEVFPEEAELLTFAVNVKGNLTLSLRRKGDPNVNENLAPLDFRTLQDALPGMHRARQTMLKERQAGAIELPFAPGMGGR